MGLVGSLERISSIVLRGERDSDMLLVQHSCRSDEPLTHIIDSLS